MQRIAGNLLIALNALLLFFLIFEHSMVIPAWLQSVGRMHPLLLHLPIGAVIIALLAIFLKKDIKIILALAAVTAALTALMGIVLAKEGGYDEQSLAIHKYSGAALSFILAAAYYFSEQKLILAPTFIILLVAGHYGSILTHGDSFVLEPLLAKKENKLVVSDSTSMYAAAIKPVLHRKCTSCHNEQKAKGDLVLSSLAGLAKGGEHGDVWKAGSPQASLLMKRILLPEDHDDHMPPKGKEQLSAPEVQLLFQWILSGADTSKAWTKYSPSDSVRKIAEQFIHSGSAEAARHYTFDAASPETIEKLNDPYRTVVPVALNEPGLSATFFIRNEFKPSRLEELTKVKDQLVSLNLSKMPVTDSDCETIRKFEQLEKLNLNFSDVTNEGLKKIASLKNLKSLSVAGTRLDNSALDILKEFKNLKEVFVWNTGISNALSPIPNVQWNTGFVPSENEKLKLTPPIPVSDKTLYDKDELVALTHKLPGTIIRYTTDGTDPDSTSAAMIYEKPFAINGYTIVKTRACKDGWSCSPIGRYILYNKGLPPLETKLFTKPNKGYAGEGAATFSNNKKGYVDDHRDIAWIGFRDNPLSAEFKFAAGTTVRDITICYDHNIDAWLFPPSKVEVWGGKDPEHLQLIKDFKPTQPTARESARNSAVIVPIEGNYEVYKIVAWPVAELPKWHDANKPGNKDKRAWLFVDEVIFD